MFFEVFSEIVFLAQFKVVSEVVDLLMGQESFLIYLIESILFAPYYIPVILHSLFIPSLLKGIMYAVREVCSVLDLRTMAINGKLYICE